MSSITAHRGRYNGGDGGGFQSPPADSNDINAADISPVVQGSVSNGFPPMHFSFIVGCHAGADSEYGQSWLAGSGSTTNRAAIGFKDDVNGTKVDLFLAGFRLFIIAGMTCYEAAHESWAGVWNDAELDDDKFRSDVAFYGDKSTRIRFVYDGQQSAVYTKWCRKGT